MEPLETQATKDTANTGGPARALIFYQNWAEIISFTSAGLVHWLCGTCLSICFEFLCLWGQDCQSLLQSPLWNGDLVLPGSCLNMVHHHKQPQGLSVCPLLTPGFTKWWAISLRKPFQSSISWYNKHIHCSQQALAGSSGQRMPKGGRLTSKGCWCRMNPGTPSLYQATLNTDVNTVIKPDKMDFCRCYA